MAIGARREQQSDSKACRTGDMNDQLIALLDRPVGTDEVGVDSNQRQGPHEFTATAKVTGGREAPPIGMLSRDRVGGEAQSRVGAMQMAALRSAAHLDALENLGLEGSAKPLRGCEATAARGVLEISGGGDPQLLVELAHPLSPQSGYAQHVEDARRELFAHRLQSWMMARLMELGDHAGDGIADARDFGEPAFSDQPLQRQRTERQVVGGAGIGTGTVGIAARQFQPLSQLPEEFRNRGSIQLGHVRRSVLKNNCCILGRFHRASRCRWDWSDRRAGRGGPCVLSTGRVRARAIHARPRRDLIGNARPLELQPCFPPVLCGIDSVRKRTEAGRDRKKAILRRR